MSDAIPFPAPVPAPRLTDLDIQALARWARDSTLPAWRDLAPPGNRTPPQLIAALIAEWQAMGAVLDLTGEFATNLRDLIARFNAGDGA